MQTVDDYRRAARPLVPPWVSVSVKVDVFGRRHNPTVVVSLGGRRIYRALLKRAGRDEVAARVSTLADRMPLGCELEVRWS